MILEPPKIKSDTVSTVGMGDGQGVEEKKVGVSLQQQHKGCSVVMERAVSRLH